MREQDKEGRKRVKQAKGRKQRKGDKCTAGVKEACVEGEITEETKEG